MQKLIVSGKCRGSYPAAVLPLTQVPYAQLDGGIAPIIVLDYGVADIERITVLDVVIEIRHIEGDGRDLVIWLRLLNQVQLHVHATGTDLASRPRIIDILRLEHGIVIARAERLELLEYAEELRVDLGEVQFGVNLHHRSHHLLDYVLLHETVHAARELLKVLFLQREAGGVHVTAEVLQEV